MKRQQKAKKQLEELQRNNQPELEGAGRIVFRVTTTAGFSISFAF